MLKGVGYCKSNGVRGVHEANMVFSYPFAQSGSDTMKQDDSMRQDSMKQDSMKQDITKQDQMKKDDMAKDKKASKKKRKADKMQKDDSRTRPGRHISNLTRVAA